VNALTRALSARVMLVKITIGRKGLLGYLKSLGGSNIVKIVPAAAGAGESQDNGHKGLKVVCGSNTGYLEDTAWIGEKTPVTVCDVRVKPKYSVKPNIGASEFAEALNRVLPFTLIDDNRPVLQCVYIKAGEGKLTLVSADGFRLAMVKLDYEDGEGAILINRNDLTGIANAVSKAKRLRVSFDNKTHIPALDIETDLIRYKFTGADGTYPDYEKLIPTEFKTVAHFDTIEAIKAVSSLKALADSKAFPVDLNISNGMVTLSSPDDNGQSEMPADTEGEVKIRVDGGYLASALRACGGMVDCKVSTPNEPMLFSSDGFQIVVMPMMVGGEKKAEAEAGKAETANKPEGQKASEPAPKPKGKGKNKAEKATNNAPKPKGKGEKKAEPEAEAEQTPATEDGQSEAELAGVA
jgi:DNA polymerase-3 subunit beta